LEKGLFETIVKTVKGDERPPGAQTGRQVHEGIEVRGRHGGKRGALDSVEEHWSLKKRLGKDREKRNGKIRSRVADREKQSPSVWKGRSEESRGKRSQTKRWLREWAWAEHNREPGLLYKAKEEDCEKEGALKWKEKRQE